MGSCYSCLDKDSVPHNHPTKFKVTNVDDEGVEWDSWVMELTQTELVLQLDQQEAVRWPYLSLQRYGCYSDLFCFESGSHCPTGQGIYAFKCSRTQDISNLLRDCMQCNHINIIQPPELDRPRGPPQPIGNTVSSFSSGFPGCSGESPRFSSAPRRPSTNSLRHPSPGEESTHTLIASDATYVYMEIRSRHCLQPQPEGRVPFPPQTQVSDQRDPQVLLQPGQQVKFVSDPSPARRPEERGWSGLAHRLAALLHYKYLPPLPPVWESQQLGGEAGDDGDSRDGLTPSSNGFPGGEEDETPLQKPTSTRASARSHSSFPVPLTRRRGSPRVFNFDFRRPVPEPPRQLNYIQVDLKDWGTACPKGPQNPSVSGAPGPTPHPARSSDSYAVIDLEKTVALSNLRRALPRDDGTVRKTRHNSTDLPP